MQADRVIRALSALAQEHRLAAFRLLVQAGEQGVAAGVLAEKLDVPPSSMSFHLAQLANAGLVTQRRESRSIIYSADYAAMNGLAVAVCGPLRRRPGLEVLGVCGPALWPITVRLCRSSDPLPDALTAVACSSLGVGCVAAAPR